MRSMTLVLLLAIACRAGTASRAEADRVAPYSVALLYCGHEAWIGNNLVVPADDPSYTPGALLAIKNAVAQADLARRAPPGSLGLAISFTALPFVRVPLGPVATLTSDALGTQRDYLNVSSAGIDLVRALTFTMEELAKAPARTKQIVIVSDGNDRLMRLSIEELVRLRLHAAAKGIAIASIVHKSPMSLPETMLASSSAATENELATQLAQALVPHGR